MKECAPLFTAKQWLKRYHSSNMPLHQMAKRVVEAAGLGDGDDDNLEEAVGALLGSGATVQLGVQVDTLVAVLLGLCRAGRGLVLTVEDAEHIDKSSLDVIDGLIKVLRKDSSRVRHM